MEAPCPYCQRPTSIAADNPHRPFCSERCRLIDLGDWIAENHVIPGPPVVTDTDAENPGNETYH